jgi:hypothetical protein
LCSINQRVVSLLSEQLLHMLKERSAGYVLLVGLACARPVLAQVSCHFAVMNRISSVNQNISFPCHVTVVFFLYSEVRVMYL